MPDLSRTRPDTPRIAPLDPLTPAAAEILDGIVGAPDGSVLNIFGTLAHRPDLLQPFLALGGHLLLEGRIPGREREIVILRIGAKAAAVYEFGQHRLIGAQSGLSEAEIAALAGPVDAGAWSDDDRALITLADELSDDDSVSDATWAALARRWDEGQLVELLLLAGYYRMVSGFLNGVGAQLDGGVPGWPGEPA